MGETTGHSSLQYTLINQHNALTILKLIIVIWHAFDMERYRSYYLGTHCLPVDLGQREAVVGYIQLAKLNPRDLCLSKRQTRLRHSEAALRLVSSVVTTNSESAQSTCPVPALFWWLR